MKFIKLHISREPIFIEASKIFAIKATTTGTNIHPTNGTPFHVDEDTEMVMELVRRVEGK